MTNTDRGWGGEGGDRGGGVVKAKDADRALLSSLAWI
jgi:hypothetical protein